MFIYSDPERENIPNALPDVEVFYADEQTVADWQEDGCLNIGDGPISDLVGWYWWPCFPGCLPDGDPMGPFDSEEEATRDAQDI
jgi:hypothetical protein